MTRRHQAFTAGLTEFRRQLTAPNILLTLLTSASIYGAWTTPRPVNKAVLAASAFIALAYRVLDLIQRHKGGPS